MIAFLIVPGTGVLIAYHYGGTLQTVVMFFAVAGRAVRFLVGEA